MTTATPSSQPATIWLAFEILKGLTPLIIGCAAASIAALQVILGRQKIRLELFDRRLAVYNHLQSYLWGVQYVDPASFGGTTQLSDAETKGRFLFRDEMTRFIEGLKAEEPKMMSLAYAMRMHYEQSKEPFPPELKARIEERGDWSARKQQELDALIEPYLSLRNVQ